MKRILLMAALVTPMPFLNGCMSMSGVVEQLKNDPAQVDFNLTTIYGAVSFHRQFPTNWVQPVQVTMPTTVVTNTILVAPVAPAK